MSGVRQVTVEADAAEQRLDRWLRRLYPDLPQSLVERLCRKGDIRVDGGRVRASTKLEPGQVVRLPPMPGPAPATPREAFVSEADAAMIRAAVLYRDADVIALNKPPGLAVQGGSGQTRHVDGLAEALRFEREDKPRLVHRLDRDTSGILLLARSGRAAAGLARAGLTRNDITDVVLTHLHFDHAGGTVRDDSGTSCLNFPKATYHLQRRHWKWAHQATDKDRGSFRPEDFAPLEKSGQLHLLEGGTEVLFGPREVAHCGASP